MVPQPPNGANPGGNAASEVLIQPGSGHIMAIANDRSYGFGKNQTTVNYAVNTPVRRRGGRADRLLVQAVHPGHRPGAGRAVRFPADRPGGHDADRVHQLQGRADRALARDQRLDVGKGRVQPVQRDRPVGQHLLRHAGAQGRPVQRGQDGRRAGRDPGGRQVAAEVGPTDQPPADDLPSFTLGSVNVVPDEHGRGLRDRAPPAACTARRSPWPGSSPGPGPGCRSRSRTATRSSPPVSPTRPTTSCRAC